MSKMLRCLRSALRPRAMSSGYQVVLPYFGLFAYIVGRKRWLIDPNTILYISPGWEFVDEHPVPQLGHAAVLVNPARELLDEICDGPGPAKCSAFMSAARPSTTRLRLLTHQMLRLAPEADDPLHRDELVAHALDEAINGPTCAGMRASRVVDRAKEVLHARSCERLSLDEIAKEVGVSPVYLTQEFTRSEGAPLYRYQLRLRLNRALLELPHCDDITGLALDLGFSSHSHLTSVFRAIFGMTPSEYRRTVGSRQLQLGKLLDAPLKKRRAA